MNSLAHDGYAGDDSSHRLIARAASLENIDGICRQNESDTLLFRSAWKIHAQLIGDDYSFTTSTPHLVVDKGFPKILRNIEKVVKYFSLLRLLQLWWK